MPKSFLDRYQAGDCAAVWDDLVSLGSAAAHQLYLADAQAVARETMRRARRNVEMLIGKLEQLNYTFPDSVSEGRKELDRLTKLESRLLEAAKSNFQFSGTVVESLKHLNLDPHELTRRAMEVSRERTEIRMAARDPEWLPKVTKMKEQAEQAVAKLRRKPPLQDPAIFCPPGKTTAKLITKVEKLAGGPMPLSLRAWYEEVGSVSFMGEHPILNTEGPVAADPLVMYPLDASIEWLGDFEGTDDGILLLLSPDDLHKANTSGGDPYSMRVPEASADGPLLGAGHDLTLVGYLRRSFAWRGFPGWEGAEDAPTKELDFLREGLLPI